MEELRTLQCTSMGKKNNLTKWAQLEMARRKKEQGTQENISFLGHNERERGKGNRSQTAKKGGRNWRKEEVCRGGEERTDENPAGGLGLFGDEIEDTAMGGTTQQRQVEGRCVAEKGHVR